MKAKVIDMQKWKQSKLKPIATPAEILAIPDIVQIFKALGINLEKLLPEEDKK